MEQDPYLSDQGRRVSERKNRYASSWCFPEYNSVFSVVGEALVVEIDQALVLDVLLLLIWLWQRHPHHSHLLLFCPFVPKMRGPLLVVFLNLFSENLGGGGGIVSPVCLNLDLLE